MLYSELPLRLRVDIADAALRVAQAWVEQQTMQVFQYERGNVAPDELAYLGETYQDYADTLLALQVEAVTILTHSRNV